MNCEQHTRSCTKIGPVHQRNHVQESQCKHQAAIDPPNDAPLLLGRETIHMVIIGEGNHSILNLGLIETRLLDVRSSFGHGNWLAGDELTRCKLEEEGLSVEQRCSRSERGGRYKNKNLMSLLGTTWMDIYRAVQSGASPWAHASIPRSTQHLSTRVPFAKALSINNGLGWDVDVAGISRAR